MSVVFGELSSFPYVQAWSDAGFSMDPKGIGEFSSAELGNFFGPHEIVIEHRLLRAGELVLQVLLPYSAVLLASGEQ
jgi:hypothetical protein